MKRILLTLFFVQISFLTFSQANGGGSQPIILDDFDWFPLDSINFEDESELFLLDSFEENIWHIAQPAKELLNEPLSAPNVIITDSLNLYPILNHSYFDVFTPNFEDWGQVFIGFSHKYDSDTLRDGLYLEYSEDAGDTWLNLRQHLDEAMFNLGAETGETNMYQDSDTLYNGENGYSGKSLDWEEVLVGWYYLPLGGVRGFSTGESIIRFHFLSDDIDNSREGWMIDDIFQFFVDLGGSTSDRNEVSFNLFPNPSSDILTARTEMSYQVLKMEISSFDSKKVIQSNQASGNIVSASGLDLSTGVYLVTVYGDDEFLGTARCVMQR